MNLKKKIASVLLCVLMLSSFILPVHAVNVRMGHVANYDVDFGVNSSGLAQVYVAYEGNATSFTDITVKTYIQKRSLGLVWTKVDNGEPNKTWVDTSTSQTGTFVHNLQLDSTGTYRAVFKITFSGTGASDDVITERIEDVYS